MAYSGKLGSTRPDKRGYATVLTDLGISASKPWELTCKGYSDGTSAAGALKSASDKYAGMIREDYKKIGVGAAADPEGTVYWCFIFTE